MAPPPGRPIASSSPPGPTRRPTDFLAPSAFPPRPRSLCSPSALSPSWAFAVRGAGIAEAWMPRAHAQRSEDRRPVDALGNSSRADPAETDLLIFGVTLVRRHIIVTSPSLPSLISATSLSLGRGPPAYPGVTRADDHKRGLADCQTKVATVASGAGVRPRSDGAGPG